VSLQEEEDSVSTFGVENVVGMCFKHLKNHFSDGETKIKTHKFSLFLVQTENLQTESSVFYVLN
jgi:hypothetical protein